MITASASRDPDRRAPSQDAPFGEAAAGSRAPHAQMGAEPGNDRASGGQAGGPDAPIETLRRWQESGARWRVVSRAKSRITIALMTCDGGETVHALTSTDPELLAFVGSRSSSEQ
jgi:hypothetical protein